MAPERPAVGQQQELLLVVGVAGEVEAVSAAGLPVVVEVANGGRVRHLGKAPTHRLQVQHRDPAITVVSPDTGQPNAQTGDRGL
jgi:hypothetical protein